MSLNDYDCTFNQTDAGETVLNYSEAVRELRWNVQMFTDGRFSSLHLRLEPRKLGHLPRLPVVTGIYSINNYSLSGLSVYDIQFTNITGKVQKAW